MSDWCTYLTFQSYYANPLSQKGGLPVFRPLTDQDSPTHVPCGFTFNDKGYNVNVNIPDYAFAGFVNTDKPLVLESGVSEIGVEAFAFAEIGRYETASQGNLCVVNVEDLSTPPAITPESFTNYRWAVMTKDFEQYKLFNNDSFWKEGDRFTYPNLGTPDVPTLTSYNINVQSSNRFLLPGEKAKIDINSLTFECPDGVAQPSDEEALKDIKINIVEGSNYQGIIEVSPEGEITAIGVGAPESDDGDYNYEELTSNLGDEVRYKMLFSSAVVSVEADYTKGLTTAVGSEFGVDVATLPYDMIAAIEECKYVGRRVGYPEPEFVSAFSDAITGSLYSRNNYSDLYDTEIYCYRNIYDNVRLFSDFEPVAPERNTAYRLVVEMSDGHKYYVCSTDDQYSQKAYRSALVPVEDATAENLKNATVYFEYDDSNKNLQFRYAGDSKDLYLYTGTGFATYKLTSTGLTQYWFQSAGRYLNAPVEEGDGYTYWTPTTKFLGKFVITADQGVMSFTTTGSVFKTNKAYYTDLISSLVNIVPADDDPFAPRAAHVKGDADGDGGVSIIDITTAVNALLQQGE